MVLKTDTENRYKLENIFFGIFFVKPIVER